MGAGMWPLAIIAFVLAFVWIVKWCAPIVAWRRRIQYVRAYIPQAPGKHWLRGNVPENEANLRETTLAYAAMMPRVFIQWYGFAMPQVTLCHPDTIADAMRTAPNKFQFVYEFWKPWLGKGLVTSAGPRWARDRRLLSHVFSLNMLREYVPVYKDTCATMIGQWAAAAGQNMSIDVGKCMPLLTFDVILQCAMGVETSCQTSTNPDSPHIRYLHAVETVVDLIMKRYHQPWLWWDVLYHRTSQGRAFLNGIHELHEYSLVLIRKRRQELEEDVRSSRSGAADQRHTDMLQTMLTVRDEEGIGMTDVEIREQVDTFLFAGRDTSSAALQWSVYYLVKYPDIQEKCRAEVLQVMEMCGGIEGLEHEHISRLQYLSQFVLEVLRDACILPDVSRTLTKDASVNGIRVPAGMQVQMNMLAVHHNSQVWDNPHTFNPDRFAPGVKRHPYAFIPFAAGARNCIGKHFVQDEIKVVLAAILTKFVLLQDSDREMPSWRQTAFSYPYPNLHIKVREV